MLEATRENDPVLFQRIAANFEHQGMMRHFQASLLRVTLGKVELWLPYSDKLTQQNGGFHGGAIGAIADAAAGYAAVTTVPPDMQALTAEYKINFLSMYKEGALRAIGQVVKSGKRVIVAHAEVLHVADGGKESLCAVMQQTLVPVPMMY